MKHRKNLGFTLIELILYIALVSIFLSALVIFAWNIIFARVKSSTQQVLSRELRFSAKRIAYEIRNASSIISLSPSSLSLSSSDSARNPTIIDLSSGRLRIAYGSAGPCPQSAPCFLTSDDILISNLVFNNLSNGNSTNIKFSISALSEGARSEWQGTSEIFSSSELRSK